MTARAGLLIWCLIPVVCGAQSVEEFCERKWPGDFSMLEHCISDQVDGAAQVEAFFARYSLVAESLVERARQRDAAAVIAVTCFSKWDDDWAMTAYCVNEQEQAAIRLGRLGTDPGSSAAENSGYSAVMRWLSSHGLRGLPGDELRDYAETDPNARLFVGCDDSARREAHITGRARLDLLLNCLEGSESER